MRAAQLVVVEYDGWIARQLSDLAADGGWRLRGTRGPAAARPLVRHPGPCVLIVQVELAEDEPAAVRLIADVRTAHPDVPVIAVSDVKLSDADRGAWTAALFDLGARYVLFPPLTRPVLEDVVSGLMAAAIRRTIGPEAAKAPATPASKDKPKSKSKPADDVIDLADEGLHE